MVNKKIKIDRSRPEVATMDRTQTIQGIKGQLFAIGGEPQFAVVIHMDTIITGNIR